MANKPLLFNAFTMNCVSFINHGLWRHPETRQTDYTDLDTWVELARMLERGRFDTLFFADVIGTYDVYRGGLDTAIREATQFPNNDPSVLIPALAHATEHLGFAFTGSVLQEHPFTFARKVSTLDHLTKGRVAWNIVTSFQSSAGRNFGFEEQVPHDERYVWADEYMEVVYKLWEGSWEDGAILCDKENGVYADPARVHPVNHAGVRYRVAGPHLSEPSPLRTPVLFQAGSSEAGRSFAARHAEGTFILAPNPLAARTNIEDVRARAVAAGRRADDIAFFQGLSFVVGSTEEEARRKNDEIDDHLSVEGLMTHMSGNIGVDLSAIDPHKPLSELRTEVAHGAVRGMIEGAPDQTQTFADLARLVTTTRVVGTPEQIADGLETWAAAGVDGFNITYVITPGTFEDFIDHAVPVLQERGLMRREYEPGTLREKLRPGAGPRLPRRHPAASYRHPRTQNRETFSV
ncbi:LLM class flavin-dependent oxidoreductase [Streptomyces eurythermus]|uniref:LLM class flavin-dependent oxidoreductase n=1 Tax=Streptomyces eurythermus TaxID=42237 RepID=UPI0036A3F3AE